jgi:phage protein U
MMMALGQFVFSLTTAPFGELQRRRTWKHTTSSRIGTRDASQFTGAGDDTITLSGIVAQAESIGSIASIEKLAEMADAGDAYVLVDGGGRVYGCYIVEGLDETKKYFTSWGIARKIEFNLSLKRVDDSDFSKAAQAAMKKVQL